VNPLILTLTLDAAAQAFYEELRRYHFPPERNLIPAHVTLFHQLPDEERTYETLRDAAGATSTFLLKEPTLRSLGRGVAIFFATQAANTLHSSLSSAFQAHLIAQDRQRFQPHIVVQNKVDPETARQTMQQLHSTRFIEPGATGLTLWRYLGGPWELLQQFPFRESF
jgi:2'-5' RNA ligase